MKSFTICTLLFLLTLKLIIAHETDGCNNEKKDNGLFMVLALCGGAYIFQQHKLQQEEEEEDYESSGEEESGEEEEEGENSEEEMEDEQDDDSGGDNGNTSEEEGDEEEEEGESDGELEPVDAEPVTNKRRSSRLGGKSMGYAAKE